MGLMNDAEGFLDDVLNRYAAETVTYTHGGVGFEIPAVVGKTVFRVCDASGMTIRITSTDFIVDRLALGFEPERNDLITYNGERFCVSAPANEPVWRFSGDKFNSFRIHTSAIGVAGDEDE